MWTDANASSPELSLSRLHQPIGAQDRHTDPARDQDDQDVVRSTRTSPAPRPADKPADETERNHFVHSDSTLSPCRFRRACRVQHWPAGSDEDGVVVHCLDRDPRPIMGATARVSARADISPSTNHSHWIQPPTPNAPLFLHPGSIGARLAASTSACRLSMRSQDVVGPVLPLIRRRPHVPVVMLPPHPGEAFRVALDAFHPPPGKQLSVRRRWPPPSALRTTPVTPCLPTSVSRNWPIRRSGGYHLGS